MRSGSHFKHIGLFFALFSIIFLLVGGIGVSMELSKRGRCTVEVDAMVVDNVVTSSWSNNSNHMSFTYTPVFEYEYDGLIYTGNHNVSTNPPAYAIGEWVVLNIDPTQPQVFYVAGSMAGILIGGIGLFIGIVSLGAGLACLLRYRYWRNMALYE